MDNFTVWICGDDTEHGTKYCPDEGCSKQHGCARAKGWKPGMAYDQFTGEVEKTTSLKDEG